MSEKLFSINLQFIYKCKGVVTLDSIHLAHCVNPFLGTHLCFCSLHRMYMNARNAEGEVTGRLKVGEFSL